jgi:uncharacterized protein YqeY
MNKIEMIKIEMTKALKSVPQEKKRLNTLRMLLAALEKEKVNLKLPSVEDLSDEDFNLVIQKELKMIEQEKQSLIDASRDTSNVEERKSVYIEFAPKQLSDEELTIIVQEKIESMGISSIKEQGKLMGVLSKELKGKTDLGRISGIIRSILK